MDTYILDTDDKPILEPDLVKWGKWLATTDLHIAFTQLGAAHVSTLFLAVDHNYARLLFAPVLYETMIFWYGHELDNERRRYATRDEALAGHETMVARVRAALN